MQRVLNYVTNPQHRTTVLASLFGLFLIGYLIFRYVAPFGAIVTYQFTALSDKGKLSALNGVESGQTLNTSDKGVSIPKQLIRKNIVTFNLALLSKKIDGIWVRMKFTGNPKEVKLGVRGDTNKKYAYKPLYNILLDQLPETRADSGLLFWQKTNTYQSFEQFATALPKDKSVATYYFDPSALALPNDIKSPGKKAYAVTTQLRGSHTLYVRVDTQPFTFAVAKKDANMYEGEDVLTLELYKQDRLIATTDIGDDGVVDTSKLSMVPQKGGFDIPKLEKGVYKILIKDNSKGSDVQITEIHSNQEKVVFADSMFIVDTKPATLYTTVKELSLQTNHTQSLQNVSLDGQIDLPIIKITDAAKFELNLPPDPKNPNSKISNAKEVHTITMPKNDLMLRGKGYFAFSADQLFDPTPIKTVDVATLKSLDSVDYVIANYTKAKKVGDAYEASAFFDAESIEINGDKLYFSLEIPGLEQTGGELELQNLEVTVEKPRLGK